MLSELRFLHKELLPISFLAIDAYQSLRRLQAIIPPADTLIDAFAVRIAQLNDAANSEEFAPAERLVFIRLTESPLNTPLIGIRDLHGNRQRYSTFFDGIEQTLLAVF